MSGIIEDAANDDKYNLAMPLPRATPLIGAAALVSVVSLLSAWSACAADDPTGGAPRRTPPLGPFAVGTTTVEVAGVTWLESWNKNLATDRLVGGRVAIGQDWKAGWQAIGDLEVQRAELGRARDGLLVGLSGLARRQVVTIGRTQVFVELGLGASLSTRPVPIRGTAVNFLLQGGGGVVYPVGPRSSFVLGTRVWHLSNGGIIENQRHNPDIEGIGGYAGIQVHFR